MRILQLSDTHVSRCDGPNSYGVDPRQSLRLMVDSLAELRDVDVVVLSGDLADDGSAEGTAFVLEAVQPLAQRLGAPVVSCMGNHDLRGAFTDVLGSGHLGPGGRDIGRLLDSPDGERAAVSLVAGHRVLTLDAMVPGKAFGWISERQLAWLAGELATPHGEGSVLVFHQPPFALDVAVQQAFRLQNPEALEAAMRGSDVRLVLCGHFHQPIVGSFAGVPCLVAPAVVNRVDLTAPVGTERAVKGAAALLTTLIDGRVTTTTLMAADPAAGQLAYELGAAELQAIVADLGP